MKWHVSVEVHKNGKWVGKIRNSGLKPDPEFIRSLAHEATYAALYDILGRDPSPLVIARGNHSQNIRKRAMSMGIKCIIRTNHSGRSKKCL